MRTGVAARGWRWWEQTELRKQQQPKVRALWILVTGHLAFHCSIRSAFVCLKIPTFKKKTTLNLKALQFILQDSGHEKWFEPCKALPGLSTIHSLPLLRLSSRTPQVAFPSSHAGLAPVLAEDTRGPTGLWVLQKASQTMNCLFPVQWWPGRAVLCSFDGCSKKL